MMLLGSPGLWLPDLAAFTPVYDWTGVGVSTAAGAWRTYINQAGAGVLTFCQAWLDTTLTEGTLPDIRITVDGGTPATIAGGSGGVYQLATKILFPIFFKSSLLVEVRNPSASSRTVVLDYTYLLKTGAPLTSRQALVNSGTRQGFNASFLGGTLTTVVNIAGAGWFFWVDARREGNYSAIVDLTVDGVSKISDRIIGAVGSG
ncbi:MAG TPA: hypothetical protein VD902_11455, partial [Symbiobacteriaceae bacterium]|nr:hypothetical protein [Symbiobacteriaceae bacterium]